MATNGVCVIKSEFILPDHERQISLECISNEDKASIEESAENAEGISEKDDEIQEPCYKKQKLSKREKKKLRGQNKARPLPFKRDITLELCKVLTNVAENEEPKTCQNERCHFLHDPQEYLKLKPTDIRTDWTNEQTLLFIELYENMPVLWDAKHPEHKNRVKLNEAWVNLQKLFDESISIVDLKKKKESLMASYRPLRKKVVESEETGSGTDDVFKPTWYAFEAIDRFMRARGEKNPAINSEDDWTKETHDEEIEYETKYMPEGQPVSASRGNDCFNYKVCGRCPWGLACRFASAHTKTDGRNIVNQTIYEQHRQKQPTTLNILTQELQQSLRKRMYDFKTSEDVIKNNDKLRQSKINSNSKIEEKQEPKSNDNNTDLKVVNNCTSPKTSGTVTDEDVIKLRISEKKKIEWHDKLILTPLTTVGNLPFRRICKEFGADVTCGEMAMSASLLQGASQEWALTKKHHTEDIFGVQLCGNNPHVITKSAQVLQENMEIDFIDLNLGCPIDLVYKQGGGSGLLRRERVLESIVRCTNQVLNIPLTIKTRTGVYGDQNIAHTLVPKFRDWGVSMVTIHGRSREQRYTRIADWPYIDKCAALSTPMPVFGNGDILSYEDYKYARENYKNVAGVAIGRGALIKPWLFMEIKEQKLWDISSSERFDILKKYANYGLEHWGSDTKGVENTRRFMLEWLSFLYRYVPVGILEKPPQRINERPPFYKGRDDLETLMASSSCADWIKISEMLLGPVPDNFNFLPKHKANSYK